MPHSFILAPLAESDLNSIREYISRDNPHAAKKVIEDIFSKIESLLDYPNLGHMREDLTNKPVKFLRVRHYLIVYRPETSPLQIVRVLSGFRDISSLM